MRKDDDDEDNIDVRYKRTRRLRRVPSGRVYVHDRCGGMTRVSDSDFTHICDPFWPCTSTYCCTCSDFAPLDEVYWEDTEELVSEFRHRVRRATPGIIQAWRFGVGFVVGGLIGCGLGLIAGLGVQADSLAGFGSVGALIGAFVCYLIGTLILNQAFDVDYRRIK